MKNLLILTISLFIFLLYGSAQDHLTKNRSNRVLDFNSERFSFAIIADPQVSGKKHSGEVGVKAAENLEKACEELNNMGNMPLFTVFLGDLVNTFNPQSVENFIYRIRNLKSRPILIHGNHDTRPPYTEFKALCRKINGSDEVYFSFDVGNWHFIALPCNFSSGSDLSVEILNWLENDLRKNSHKPTIVFEHLHLVPLGLSQLEWYTFDMKLRRSLLDLLSRYGNVKYYFNGHVHNGIKASVKMRWEYKGIKFITVPTIIQGRPFDEEYPEFEEGLENGGYYLLMHINGNDVKLEGRLVDNKNSFIYPSEFPVLTEDVEPRWFKTIPEFQATSLKNGDFTNDLEGWYKNYRYISDERPAYIYRHERFKNLNAAYLFTRSKPPLAWSNDERTEMYQVVCVKEITHPFLEASYAFDQKPADGGGYIRLTAMNEDGFEFLMFFRWGAENEYQSDYVPRSLGFELTGKPSGWNFLSDLAREKKAFFFDLNESVGNWNQLSVNIADLYNKALNRPGAYEGLNINRLYLGLATWCNKPLHAESGVYITDIKLADKKNAASSNNENEFEISDNIFQTRFGKGLDDRVKRRSELQEKEARGKNLPKMSQVTIVDITSFPDAERVLVASMQGQLAKQGIFLYLKTNQNDIWVPEIEKTGVEILQENNTRNLLIRYSKFFQGYVKCSIENVRIAATVSGPLNALVITPETEPLMKLAGLKKIKDVSGKEEEWLYEYVKEHLNQYDLTAITQHNASRPSSLIDFAIANNYICMQGMGQPELVRKFYQLIETASPKFGFGTPFKNERKDVSLSAEEGLYTIPSSNSHNLSFYSATKEFFPANNHKVNVPAHTSLESEKVHYVMIMMSDGDNLNWHTGGLATEKYMNNPHAREIPVSWMYPPEIVDVAPILHNYYVKNYPDHNHLLGGVSGAGYTFPSIHKELEKYSVKTNEYMQKAGLEYCVIMDFLDFRTGQKQLLKQMLRYMPDVKGLFYMDYSNYAKWKGDIYFIDEKPIVSFKYRLWLPMNPLEKIAENINNAPRDPGSLDGYSTVVVHAWSYGMDEIIKFVKLLKDDVRIVGAHDFMELVNRNLKK